MMKRETAMARCRPLTRRLRMLLATALLIGLFVPNGHAIMLCYRGLVQDGSGVVDGLYFVRSVVVSPDGEHLYAAGSGENAVAVFRRDAATGGLTFVEVERDGVDGVDGLAGAEFVTVSPDGAHLYVAGRGEHAVAVFQRDAITGALTFVEAEKDGVGGVDGLDQVASVAVSPDGMHVYAAGHGDNALAVFDRDAASGALTFVEAQQDGAGGVDGLSGVQSVAVTPDGAHVVAAGDGDDAVVVFRRDAGSGALTLADVRKDGVDGVDGLDGANAVALNPDGGHVYVTGYVDSAVAAFGLDAETGVLTFLEWHQDGSAGVEGLGGAWSLAVGPDGRHLYAAGEADYSIAVFRRDAGSGALTFVESQLDGVLGVDALNNVLSVTVSPDGENVYAASEFHSGVAIFNKSYSQAELDAAVADERRKWDAGNDRKIGLEEAIRALQTVSDN